MVSVRITVQMSNSTKANVKMISKTTNRTEQRKMLGKIENRSRTKKETIHLQIDTTTEEEVGEPMQIAKKKVQKKTTTTKAEEEGDTT